MLRKLRKIYTPGWVLLKSANKIIVKRGLFKPNIGCTSLITKLQTSLRSKEIQDLFSVTHILLEIKVRHSGS